MTPTLTITSNEQPAPTLAHHVAHIADDVDVRDLVRACSDVPQVRDALTVAQILRRGFVVVDALEDRIRLLTGMLASETPLTASELCDGELDEHIRDGIAQVVQRVRSMGRESGVGSITISVRVEVESRGEALKLAVDEPKIKLPKRMAKGQIVRVRGVPGPQGVVGMVPVVDKAETSDRNRALFDLPAND